MSTESSKRKAINNLLGNMGKSDDNEIRETLNKEIGEYINKGEEDTSEKKLIQKVSFDFEKDFHTELKVFAATRNPSKSMLEVVVEATRIYMRDNK